MSDNKATIIMLPKTGGESGCWGSIGQSSLTIEAIKMAVEKTTKALAEVVNIESIDTEDSLYASVVKLFNTYGAAALPIIMLDGKAVCMGTVAPLLIVSALERELSKRAANN